MMPLRHDSGYYIISALHIVLPLIATLSPLYAATRLGYDAFHFQMRQRRFIFDG
jgi:hypothetical protein